MSLRWVFEGILPGEGSSWLESRTTGTEVFTSVTAFIPTSTAALELRYSEPPTCSPYSDPAFTYFQSICQGSEDPFGLRLVLWIRYRGFNSVWFDWCPLDFGFLIGNGKSKLLDVIPWFVYMWLDPLVGYLILDKLGWLHWVGFLYSYIHDAFKSAGIVKLLKFNNTFSIAKAINHNN